MTLRVEHILCVVRSTTAATRHAAHLAESFGASLDLMVLDSFSDPNDSDIRNEMRELAESDPNSDRIQVVTAPASEDAPLDQALVAYAMERKPDLLIVDRPDDQTSDPPFDSSLNRTLAEHLQCPLFFINDTWEPDSTQRILVPTDLSEASRNAFTCGVDLARAYEVSVEVLHVVDTPPYVALTPVDRLSLGATPLAEHRGRRQLRAFLQKGRRTDTNVHSHIAHGDPANQIRLFLERGETDLLVLPSHSRNASLDSPFGTVAGTLLASVTCSVCLLPVGAWG